MILNTCYRKMAINLSRKFLAILVTTLGIGITIVVITYGISANSVVQIRQTSFDSEVEIFTNVLKNSINTQIRNVKTLYIVFEYFETPVDIDLFNNITDEFLVNEVSSRAYSYVPKIYNSYRKEFEEEQSKYWKPILNREITIRSPSDGWLETSENETFYYPVTYINPVVENEGAVLFDLYSVESRQLTINTAVYVDGQTIFTPKIILVQDDEIGFLTVTCSERDNGQTVEQNFCITSVIRMSSLLEETYNKSFLKDDLIIQICETHTNEFLGCIETRDDELFFLDEETCGTKIENEKYFEYTKDLVYESEHLFWSIVIVSNSKFEPINMTSIVVNTVILSLFVTMIIGLYIYLQYREGINQLMLRSELKKSYSKWIGYMCHALRGPIHIIDYSSQNLFDDDGGVRYDNLEILRANSNRLGNLINSYIDIGAIETDKLRLIKRSTDVCEIIHNVYHEYNIMCSEKVEIRKKISYEMSGVHLKTDPVRFQQIISCGVDNACKYTKRGLIQIRVEHVGDWVEFSVVDTGTGVKDSDLNKLFDDYERGNVDDRVSGSGLGLIMSRTIAEKMKGELTLTNREDGVTGCVFKFKLPYVPVAPSDEENSVEESPEFPSHVKDLVIHVCEDERKHREILAEMLDNVGVQKHNIVFFDDGDRLVESYKRNRMMFPDLVILDIYMKNMNGDIAFQEMKKMGYKGQAIVVSGNSQDFRRFIDIGFHKIIMKPFKIDEIKDSLENSLKFIQEKESSHSLFEV